MRRVRPQRRLGILLTALLWAVAASLLLGRSAAMLGGSAFATTAVVSDSAGQRAVWLLKNGDSCGGLPRMVLAGTRGDADHAPGAPSGDQPGHVGHECWLCCAAVPSAAPIESGGGVLVAAAFSGWAVAASDGWFGPGASCPRFARGPPMTDLV